MIRLAFVIIFAILIATLSMCGFVSYRSKKPIGKSVCFFCMSLIPPVLGNMIIISAPTEGCALVGCYIYYIGMDLIMFALLRFTNEYCYVKNYKKAKTRGLSVIIHILLDIDIIQMLLNPIFGHAFKLQKIEAYGAPYYRMVPLMGQGFHRFICYGAVVVVMGIFIAKCFKVPRIYRERYVVILISMIICTIWQTFYIFSRTPVDRSMIGFAVFGLCIFYFSIYFRPLRLLDGMLANIVSDMKEAVFLFGPEGRCIWINEPGRKLAGVTDENIERAKYTLEEQFEGIYSIPEDSENELEIGTGDDTKYYIISRGTFNDSNDTILGSYVRIRDNTVEKQLLEKEIYAANHDALTGVYNREYTFKKIADKLKAPDITDYYIASVYICDFKMFNDAFGRDFGDDALIQVKDYITSVSDDRCIFGRITGDTFGSCFPKEMFLADKIEKDLAAFTVKRGTLEHHLVVHVGLYEVQEKDNDVSVLFDRTELALDSIRNDYKRHVAIFDRKIRDRMLWNQEISGQLKDAIIQGQIIPYLQPIADRNGKIVGAEVLARWIHPDHGFMPPADFIPVFEENGMIVELDKHIWKFACGILSDWSKKYPELFISVNVSPKDFYMTDVFADITRYVREYELEPSRLRIEVTETSMMNNTDGKMKVLESFRKLGFIVEMDDFGSGYSSLNMLKNMPVDVLKIDMAFLGKANDENRANVIVRNVIKLAQDLGITALTEGVETKEQFNMLSEAGSTLFQGYYFSKPVPLHEFETILERKNK